MTENEGLAAAGAAVVERREAQGMSQLALARSAGIDPKTLRALE
jgi:transcriptional regulator with XRE-family HTH domain